MVTFSKPRYQKAGPSYLFDVHYDTAEEDEAFTFFLEAHEAFTVERLQEGLRTEAGWGCFVEAFRIATVTYFTRPVSRERLLGLFRHRFPAQEQQQSRILLCLPRRIEHTQGQLWCHWSVETAPPLEIPAESQEVQEAEESQESQEVQLAVAPNALNAPIALNASMGAGTAGTAGVDGMEEWDMDAVPVSVESTVLEDPHLLMERQRVKEARLKAKVAIYRAQMEMNRFYEKYGGEVSDSDASASESESDSSDSED